jgi:hypothetical protein
MKHLIAAVLALGIIGGAAVPATAACASDSGVVISYGNGMFISPARARVQALLLDRKIRPALPAGAHVTFSYSYNNSEDDLTQVLQVAAQAIADNQVKIPSWLKAPSGAPSAFTNAVQSAERSANPDTYVKDPDLAAHVARYDADLAAGKRIIVVAHSQGNFYANRAYERLASTAGFGIVAVGTPASYTAGGGSYTTLTNDQIIEPIPGRRTPNTSNGSAFVNATKGSDGHSFTRHYLDGDVSGPKIVAQVTAALTALPCPEAP